MLRRSSLLALLGFFALMMFLCVLMNTAYKHFFRSKMPDSIWFGSLFFLYFGFDKLNERGHKKTVAFIAGAGYAMFFCFVVWSFKGAFFPAR